MNITINISAEQQEKLSYIQQKSGIDVDTLVNKAIEKQDKNRQDLEINLKSRGINQEEAQIMRDNLVTFADDWNNPEMSIYDNYEQHKNNLE